MVKCIKSATALLRLAALHHFILYFTIYIIEAPYFSPNKRSGQVRDLHKLNFYADHADANAACHKPYTKSVDKLVYK